MTGIDFSLARDLDEQARELDTLTLSADSAARANVRRRGLLADLAAANLPAGCAPALERAGLVWLAGYVRATEARAGYLASDQYPASGVDVSLDWFRLASPTPPGVDPHAWIARWETILASEPVGPAMAGFTLIRENGSWYRLEWRRDDGEHPALLRVEPI